MKANGFPRAECKRNDSLGQDAAGALDVGEARWTYRRRVVFGTLGFCGLAVVYLIGWAPSDPLRETLANALVLLAGTVVTGYVFGATWDDHSYRNAVLQNNFMAERRVLPDETPPGFAG